MSALDGIPDMGDALHCPAACRKEADLLADSKADDNPDRVVVVAGNKEADIPGNSRDSSRLSSKDCRSSSYRRRR